MTAEQPPKKKRGRPPKKKQEDQQKELQPETQIRTAMLEDRMMSYKRDNSCPECNAFPVVKMSRGPGCAFFRCRLCGHRWEVG